MTLLAITLLSGLAALSVAEAPEIEFLYAHIRGPTVNVESPDHIELSAYSEAAGLDLDNLPRNETLYGLQSRADFDIPPPTFVAAYSYYLISADGVTKLNPTAVRGSVVINWDNRSSGAVVNPAYYGFLVTHPSSPLPTATGGIVIASRKPLVIELHDTEVQVLDVLHARSGCDHSQEEHADSSQKLFRVVAKYEIALNVSQQRYLFVAYAPHHVCMDDEPNYYFKIVNADALEHEVGFSASVWPQSN